MKHQKKLCLQFKLNKKADGKIPYDKLRNVIIEGRKKF